MLDEIQTGFGRTGRWFGHQHFDLQPDIICLAKGIGGGFPMGAIAYTEQVNNALSAGAHGSTFGGNPLACAAGLAALEVYHEENLIERSEQMGALLVAQLHEAIGDRTIVREIRGVGLMIAIELREKVGPYLKSLMEDTWRDRLAGGGQCAAPAAALDHHRGGNRDWRQSHRSSFTGIINYRR